ncbi:MAG: T9SS type A sorting domain-containing protein [Bacteroidota bacterium]|nr:T9SS type A sorting domain-containing protein [Bacteroidota bacterium]
MKTQAHNQTVRKSKWISRGTFFALIFFFFATGSGFGQIPVKDGVFGQNAWYYNAAENPYPTYLDNLLPDVATGGVKYVRIGGIGPNFTPLYSWSGTTITSVTKLSHLIDEIRLNGMEPIIQVGYSPPALGCTWSGVSMTDQAIIAGNLVNQINNISYSGSKVVNWIIANEPDLNASCSGGFGYSGSTDAGNIAAYIRAFSTQMKNADPNIKIIGPELASFGNDKYYSVNIMMNDLISNPANSYSIMGTITTGNGNGKYFVDILSIHTYPTLTTRQAVIDNPEASPTGFRARFIDDGSTTNQWRGIIEMINNNNTSRSISNLKVACTEFNIANCSSSCVNESTYPDLVLSGFTNRSFIGGQWLAEIMTVSMSVASGNEAWIEFMNMWSIKEGDCSNGFGFISGCTGNKRPNYWHFKMVSDNFGGGTYYPTTPETGNADNHVKAFACTNGSNVRVLVLNQEVNTSQSSSSSKTVTISFSGSAPSGSGNYKFHTNVAVPGSFPEQTVTVDNESSYVFEFNSSGQLLSHCYYKLYGTNALIYTCETDLSCSAPTAGSNSPLCAGSTINLTASTISGATYSWTGPNSFTSSSQNPSITNCSTVMTGTYSVTATVGICTSSAGTVAVTVSAIPSAPTASSNTPVCQSATLNLTASTVSGASYSWTGPSGFSSSTQNPSRTGATVGMAGTYSVTATVNGCTSSSGTTAVTVPGFSSITAGGSTTFCSGGSVVLNASTGAGYSWQWQRNSVDLVGAIAASYTANVAGNYQVRINNGTCNAWSAPTTVTVNTTASPAAGGNTPICTGSTLNLTASTVSGATYSWTGPNSFTSSSQNPSITNCTTAMTGTYSVTATANGCTSTAGTKAITVNAIPSAPTASSNTPVCQGSTINLTASTISGATYSWTGPLSFSSSTQNPSRTGASVDMAGTYSVTATVNGCIGSTGTTTVTVPNFASIGVGGSTTFCSGGSVPLYASTGTGYSWQWIRDNSNITTGGTANNYTALVAGSYQVRIYNGTCYAWSAATIVTINSSLAATVTPAGPTTVCYPATVLLYGNTCSGYTYQWQKKDANGVYQIVSGATNANYTATTTGWYQVRTTLSGSSAWSSGVNVIINQCRLSGSATDSSTSVVSESAPDLSVYPNPTTGEFTIAINSSDEAEQFVQIEVLNAMGQLVYYATQVSVKGPLMEIPISLDANYPDGLYIVKVKVGNNVLYRKITVSRRK